MKRQDVIDELNNNSSCIWKEANALQEDNDTINADFKTLQLHVMFVDNQNRTQGNQKVIVYERKSDNACFYKSGNAPVDLQP